ncbi:MAG TPA: ATP-binding protein [Ktedonobacterales bacterium]|nr:ATP-binding protein [Ktedonobacterales bacterium]
MLFQRFVHLPRDLASGIAGKGPGLYLCRSFAEAMGSKVWVESSGVPGEGSTFHLQLPVPPPGAA